MPNTKTNNKKKEVVAGDDLGTAKEPKEIIKSDTNRSLTTGRRPKGLENIDDDLIVIPRIKLVQKMSVEVDDLKYAAGSLINSMTKDILVAPEKPLEIIPLMYSRSRIYFVPMNEKSDRMFYCRALNGMRGEGEPGGYCIECEKSKFDDDGTPPECTDFINLAVIPLVNDKPLSLPLVISFGRTSYKTGQSLINMIFFKMQSPWLFKYEIFTKPEKNDKGTFFVLKAKPAGKSPEDLIQQLEASYDMIASGKTVIHEDEEEMAREKEKMQTAGADEDDDVPF